MSYIYQCPDIIPTILSANVPFVHDDISIRPFYWHLLLTNDAFLQQLLSDSKLSLNIIPDYL